MAAGYFVCYALLIAVADSVYLPSVSIPRERAAESPRHALFVRVTHWIQTICFVVLLLSGVAILLAHPRLYWGETGYVGGPSLIDLPLPFVLDIPIRGPGRYLHFLAAWVCVFTGAAYVVMGALTRHFRRNLLPAPGGHHPGEDRSDGRRHGQTRPIISGNKTKMTVE